MPRQQIFRAPALIAFAMRAFQATSAFLIAVVLARSLSIEEFALFSSVQVWIVLLVGIASAGFPPLIVREVATFRARRDWGPISAIVQWSHRTVIVLSVFASLAFLGASQLIGLDGVSASIVLAGLPIVYLGTAILIFEAATRGMNFVLAGQIGELVVRPAVNLLLILIFFSVPGLFSRSAEMAMIALSLATAIAFSVAIMVNRHVLSAHPVKATAEFRSEWWSNLRRLSMIGWTSIFSIQIGLIFLSYSGSDTDIASFRVAIQLISIALMGMTIANIQCGPELSMRHEAGDLQGMAEIARKGALLSLGFAAVPCLIMLTSPKEILGTIFGAEFEAGALALAILSAGTLVASSTGCIGTILTTTRHEKTLVTINVTAQLAHITLLIALVPAMGAVGAAIAFASTFSLSRVVMVAIGARQTGIVSIPFRMRSRDWDY